MIKIVSRKLLGRNVRGMVIWPFLIMKRKGLQFNNRFMRHELIHARQQLELGLIFFYLLYGLEYLFRLVQYKSSLDAYKNISFEREAYSNEHDDDYLKRRGLWAFVKYM